MVNYISGLVFLIIVAVGGAVVYPMAASNPMAATAIGLAWFIGASIVAGAIKLAAQRTARRCRCNLFPAG